MTLVFEISLRQHSYLRSRSPSKAHWSDIQVIVGALCGGVKVKA